MNSEMGCFKTFRPDRLFPAWIVVDYDIVLKNLESLNPKTSVLDLSVPFLNKIWKYIEEEAQRTGIRFVASKYPDKLLQVPELFTRIALPSPGYSNIGYATEGIMVVLSAFREILELSNLAQTNEVRCRLLQRIVTCNPNLDIGDYSARNNISQISGLPMIELSGAYFDDLPNCRQLKSVVNQVRSSSDSNEVLFISNNNNQLLEGCCELAAWELAGLSEKNICTLAISIAAFAYQVERNSNGTVLRIELGKYQGLYEPFPVMIGEDNAEIIEIKQNHSFLLIKNSYSEKKHPFIARLLGYDSYKPVSQFSWNHQSLQAFLMGCADLPVYLKQKGKITDLSFCEPFC